MTAIRPAPGYSEDWEMGQAPIFTATRSLPFRICYHFVYKISPLLKAARDCLLKDMP